MDTRKRGRPGVSFDANGGFKKSKQEVDSLSTGIGSKSKPCTKFFSMSGCPFGEGCHFLHYVPGGYNTVAQLTNKPPILPPVSRNMGGPSPPVLNGSSASTPSVKSKMCNKFNTAEGCKFGDKCHFAHGEWELGKPSAPSHDDPRALGAMGGIGSMGAMGSIPSRLAGRIEPPPTGPAASFGASATAKISIDASLAGAIIGKGGVNSKHICRQTGAKLSIREHDSDPNLRNIELEGTFEQINQASAMVRELIVNVSAMPGNAKSSAMPGGAPAPAAGNFKTKLCDNFTKGSCTFGERCHFAHGANELRKSAI